MKTSESIVRN